MPPSTEKTAQQADDLSKYHTQEGAKSGLRDLIVKSVPDTTIRDLKSKKFGYERRSPRELLEHLEQEATPTNILSLNDLMDERDRKMDFEDGEGLTEFFKDINEAIRVLEDDHDITTSHSTLTARYLLQIERHGGSVFRSALREWRALEKTQKTRKRFQTHWTKADKERRF